MLKQGMKRRKKSKYKYAVIGKKKYYFYKIVWVDPCGDAGHADVDEMKKLLPATMVSQAYIFDKNSIDFQFVENREWLSGFINYKVGIDGISILFIILTTFITPLCVVSVNSTIKYRLKDFLVAILVMESLMIGVFCSLDLVVFYLFLKEV